MFECIFCKIVDKSVPSFKVFEDEDAMAFLDINPSAPGHTIVITKKHVKDIFEIDELSLRRTVGTVKLVADRIKTHLGADVMILQNNGRFAGQIIEHFNFHLIPRKENDGIHFIHKPFRLPEEEMKAMAEKLGKAAA